MREMQEIINNKIEAMSAEGVIQQTIEKAVEEAVKEAITANFKSYGSITKQIEKAIEEGLVLNIKDLPFETYNEQMLVAVKSRLGALFQGAASERFMSEMDKVLAPAPKEISINDFVGTIASFWKTDEPWDASHLDDYATVAIDIEGLGAGETVSLKMWKQKESESFRSSVANRPDMQLYIIHGKLRITHGHRYNPTCFCEHEAFVFKLYAAGTLITNLADFNEDDCDLRLKESDY